MKSQRIHIARFLIIAAMALIGVYASLKQGFTIPSSGEEKGWRQVESVA